MSRKKGLAHKQYSADMPVLDQIRNIVYGDQANNPGMKWISGLCLWSDLAEHAPTRKWAKNIKENFFAHCLEAVKRKDPQVFVDLANACERYQIGVADPITLAFTAIRAEKGSHKYRNSDVCRRYKEMTGRLISADTATRYGLAMGWKFNAKRGAPEFPQ